MQKSHSSSPQSQPKHGLETDLMGFLMELPELLEGRVQSKGVEIEVTAMVEARGRGSIEIVRLDIRKRDDEKKSIHF